MSRRAWIAIVVIAIVSVWLTFVFAKTLGDVDQATARHQVVATEAAALQARLDADRREQALVQTDAFQRVAARAYGLGAPGEIVFSLPQDAPSAPPITPLGDGTRAGSVSDAQRSPLDAWFEILFGN